MNSIKLICEAGINHQGDLDIALALMRMAADVNAYAVKFQKRNPEVSTPGSMWEVKKTWQGKEMRYIDYRNSVEFSKKEYDKIDSYSHELGINWTASVWDSDSVDFMKQYQVPFLKIPSAHLTNHGLIGYAMDCGFPLVVSTGMSTMKEISETVKIIERDNSNMLMHCHSAYPAPDCELSLPLIQKLAERFQMLVGYSSHSKTYFPALYAAVLGAEMVEVHITLDRTMEGSDHAASLEKHGLETLARELRRIPDVMNNSEKKVWPSELPSRLKLRGY